MNGVEGQPARTYTPGLDGGDGVEDGPLLPVAAELARYAAGASPAVPEGLAARVHVAIAAEPIYSPVRRFARALAPSGWPALPDAVRGVLRAALGFGRPVPLAVRAESAALIVVMLILVGAGAVAGTGGIRALASVLSAPAATPTAPAVLPPLPSATPSALPSAEASAEPGPSAEPPATPGPTPSGTPGPEGTPPAFPTGTPSSRPGVSPEGSGAPGATPEPSVSGSPDAAGSTPEPSDGGELSGGRSPGPSSPSP